MAMTMTRTRTQTALTRLAVLIANVHGELEFVDGLLAGQAGAALSATETDGLRSRRDELMASRDALYVTLRQFDANVDSDDIGVLNNWAKAYGRFGTRPFLARYLATAKSGAAWPEDGEEPRRQAHK